MPKQELADAILVDLSIWHSGRECAPRAGGGPSSLSTVAFEQDERKGKRPHDDKTHLQCTTRPRPINRPVDHPSLPTVPCPAFRGCRTFYPPMHLIRLQICSPWGRDEIPGGRNLKGFFPPPMNIYTLPRSSSSSIFFSFELHPSPHIGPLSPCLFVAFRAISGDILSGFQRVLDCANVTS